MKQELRCPRRLCLKLAALISAIFIFDASPAAGAPYEIMNASQLPVNIESVTGVSRWEPAPREALENYRFRFPTSGAIAELTSPFVLAQFNYAGSFCEILVNRDSRLPSAQRWAHRSCDFQKPLASWTVQQREDLFQEYAQLFWHRSARSDELPILMDGLDEALVGVPVAASGGALARAVLVGLCSAYLTSPAFLALDPTSLFRLRTSKLEEVAR